MKLEPIWFGVFLLIFGLSAGSTSSQIRDLSRDISMNDARFATGDDDDDDDDDSEVVLALIGDDEKSRSNECSVTLPPQLGGFTLPVANLNTEFGIVFGSAGDVRVARWFQELDVFQLGPVVIGPITVVLDGPSDGVFDVGTEEFSVDCDFSAYFDDTLLAPVVVSPFELQGTTLVGGLSFNGPSSGQIEMTWSGSVDLGGLPITFSCLTNGLFQTDYHQLSESSTIPPTNNNCAPSCSMGECCANSGPLGTGSCLSICFQESCNGDGDCDPAP